MQQNHGIVPGTQSARPLSAYSSSQAQTSKRPTTLNGKRSANVTAPTAATGVSPTATPVNASESVAALTAEIQSFETILLQEMTSSMMAESALASTSATESLGGLDSTDGLNSMSSMSNLLAGSLSSGLYGTGSPASAYSAMSATMLNTLEQALSNTLSTDSGSSGTTLDGMLTKDATLSGTTSAMPASTASVNAAISAAAARYGVPADLIRAVANQESGFDSNAVSPAGAQGIMQLMPRTAQELGVTDPFDAAQNIDAGTRYLSGLIQQVHGNIPLALAAYNAGPGAVEQYGGIPPYPETQNYVKDVLSKWQSYGADDAKGGNGANNA